MKTSLLIVAALAFTSVFADLPEPFVYWKLDSVTADGKVENSSSVESDADLDLTLGPGCRLVDDPLMGKTVRWEGTRASYAYFNCPGIVDRTISMWIFRDKTDADVDSAQNNKIPYLISGLSWMSVNWGKNADTIHCSLGAQTTSPYSFLIPSRGRWHHIAITFRKTGLAEGSDVNQVGVIASYVDGVQYAEQENFVSLRDVSLAYRAVIGNNTTDENSADPRPMKGMLSRVRIYDTALDAGQIARIYAHDISGFVSGAVGYWPLDEITENSSGARVFKPSGVALAELSAGGATVTVEDSEAGVVADFPNAYDSGAIVELPLSTPALSFGMWIKCPADIYEMMKLEMPSAPGVVNNIPHIYNVPLFSRATIEERDGDVTGVDAHFFDVGTFDDDSDQGFRVDEIVAQKNRWSHLGITIAPVPADDGSMTMIPRIYIDGVCVKTGDVQKVESSRFTGVIPSDHRVVIGNQTVGAARAFCGRMADFVLYRGLLDDNAMTELARGLPEISAGDDFTVACGAVARLEGDVSRHGKFGNRRSAAVDVSWESVSVPDGAGELGVVRAGAAGAMVELPVAGEYVFRMTARSPTLGISVSDDVTVTAVEPSEDNAPPTVSVAGDSSVDVNAALALRAVAADPDSAPGTLTVRWKFVSGPGPISFEPASGSSVKAYFYEPGVYGLVAAAFDGQTETVSGVFTVKAEEAGGIDLDGGLLRHWSFDPGQTNAIGNKLVNRTAATYEYGADGYGARVQGAFYPYIDTGVTLMETARESTGEQYSDTIPVERYRAFSLWMYHDGTDTNDSSHAALVAVPFSLGLWYNCESDCGFSMYGQTLCASIVGRGNVDRYAPPAVSPLNRWTHVYALFDRTAAPDENTSELWVDGVRMTRTSHGMGGGRVHANTVLLGGHSNNNGTGNNGHFTGEDGSYRSRTFPGVIDEVRMYNRALTEAEIRFLASNPVTDANRAPAVAVSGVPGKVLKRESVDLAALSGDDASADGLSGRWELVSGDASAAEIADPVASETTFTAKKEGVYVLSRVVSDGNRSTWSEPVVITVEKPGMVFILK